MMIKEKTVGFKTSNEKLQSLYDRTEKALERNIKFFGDKKVLVEGGGYWNVWMETQPMGGEMYWKRDAEIALNNQLNIQHLFHLSYRYMDTLTVEVLCIILKKSDLSNQLTYLPAP